MFGKWLTIRDTLRKAHVFRQTVLVVGVLGIYAAGVMIADQWYFHDMLKIGSQFHGLLGLVLGFLLVFRTNTSYDRWWEARKLWGQLVNDSRNLAVKVACCVRTEETEKAILGRRLADFAWALGSHLKGQKPAQTFQQLELMSVASGIPLASPPDAAKAVQHVPLFLVRVIYEQIESWRRADRLDGFELWVVDRHAVALMDICGACERIQKTPIATSYRMFIRHSIAFYLLTLPWGLLEQFAYWVVPVTMLLGYLLVGVELIAETIENPFGDTIDDLALDDLCQTIERSVREVLPTPSSVAALRQNAGG